MKNLNNIFRNALPVSAAALFIGISLVSCDAREEYSNETEAPAKVVNYTEPVLIDETDEVTELPESIEVVEAVEEQISIIKAVACHDIENHAPVDESTAFEVYNEKVWVYSQVKMPKGEKGMIKHVYYLDGKKIQTIELDVKGPTFRTRSYKTMGDNLCGDWKVEIVSENGTLLDTVEFEVYEYEGCGA